MKILIGQVKHLLNEKFEVQAKDTSMIVRWQQLWLFRTKKLKFMEQRQSVFKQYFTSKFLLIESIMSLIELINIKKKIFIIQVTQNH